MKDYTLKEYTDLNSIKEEIENLNDYESLGTYHHMGGTRIGESSKNSVVNTNLKLPL